MAKELPYFKFEPNQWENGNIQICNREDKGLFIDLCSMYWSRLGDLPLKLAVQKLCGGNASAFDSLIDEEIFILENEYIRIFFLDEQLNEFKKTSNQNSKNAKARWEKINKSKGLKKDVKKNASALKPQSENNTIREEEKREDDIKESLPASDKSETGESNEKEISLQTILKVMFEKYYKEQKPEPYYYQAKDAAQLKNIITKIKFIVKERQGEKYTVTDTDVIESWKTIIENIKEKDQWIFDNLSIPNINSKFNELIAKIRQTAKKKTNINKQASKSNAERRNLKESI